MAQVNSSRYKTELCRSFEESGYCKYAEKCQFAHGANEIRWYSIARHLQYKTELCRMFHTVGFCPYGLRCYFIHNEDLSKLNQLHVAQEIKLPPQDQNQFTQVTVSLPDLSKSARIDVATQATCADPMVCQVAGVDSAVACNGNDFSITLTEHNFTENMTPHTTPIGAENAISSEAGKAANEKSHLKFLHLIPLHIEAELLKIRIEP